MSTTSCSFSRDGATRTSIRVGNGRRDEGDRRPLRVLRPGEVHARDQALTLESHLRGIGEAGRKVLAPYITCGFPSPDEFPDFLRGVIDAGADLIEIGVPFTD